MSGIVLRGGRIIDPSQGLNEVKDLIISDGKITDAIPDDPQVIDVSGKIVCPGLIDIHVHLREPGQSAKETIETGSWAAAAGGFTSVVCMPNTSPVADAPNTIAWIKQRADQKAVVNVYPTGCISKGMNGELLAPIGSLFKAGVVAITDDGKCIQSNDLMRHALDYATMFDLPVMDHCQDATLSRNGVVNEGYWSTVLGLRGWPNIAEEIIVARNAMLAELTGTHVHCQHLSAAGSVRILREAKSRGIRISGEICPHHIVLTDETLQRYDSNFKMNPPLRTQADIDALLEGVADGTIEYLASDHAPHCDFEKEVEFDDAPFGIVGLETEVGLYIHHLVHKKVISLEDMINRMSTAPSNLLKLNKGTLKTGADADVTVIDPELKWTVDKNKFLSLGKNTPFHEHQLKGRPIKTIVGGRVIWDISQGLCFKKVDGTYIKLSDCS
ncbi:MAG: dihydroorotase [Verrucomicrobiota bacterium]